MNIQNKDGDTCAMLYLYQQYNHRDNCVPSYMKHDPTIVNNHGNTCAMVAVYFGREPDEWMYHDKDLKNNDGYTVR